MSKQFLRCCELLDEVFKYFGTRRDFDGDPQSKANWHADLLNAALVCRDYREPALDILWSHMDDLRPLFLVLGTFRSKRMTTKKKNKVIEPCPIMVKNGRLCYKRFARFLLYASRIRSTGNLNGFAVDIGTWRLLAAANDGRPLFPRLRHAVWYLRSTFYTDLLPLIPQTLKSLEIVHLDALYGPEFRRTTMEKERNKRVMSSRDGVTDLLVVELHKAAPDLQQLRICTKTFVCLVFLSRFQKLVDLNLDIKREFDIAPGTQAICFRSLRSLTVYAPIKSIRELMENIDCPLISSIDVRPRDKCTLEQFIDCLTYIVGKFGTALDRLAIRGRKLSFDELRRQEAIPFASSLLPVLSLLPSLLHLEISGVYNFWREGFNLTDILRAVPGLLSLKITIPHELPRDIGEYLPLQVQESPEELEALRAPTLDDLLAVSQVCPSLEELVLPILDARSPPSTALGLGAPLDIKVVIGAVRRVKIESKKDAYGRLRAVCPGIQLARWLETAH